MTYAAFLANSEQLEAHWQTFQREWHNVTLPILNETITGLDRIELLTLKQAYWKSFLVDAFIDASGILE